MSYLNGYRLHMLIMAVALLPLLQGAVAAQTFLNPNHLQDFAEASSIAELSNNLLETQVVESPPMPVITPETSPFLMMTSAPLPHTAHSNILAEIYFDWKRERIKADAGQIVEQTAALLQQDPTRRVELQATCDERGTEAYGLTMGWSRTVMITEYLKSLGVPTSQMTQISYGTQHRCKTQNPNCGQERQRHREAFRLLAMASSRAGCFVRFRLQDNQPTQTASNHIHRKPFLQRIHLAEIR